jgi:hypothetical protein
MNVIADLTQAYRGTAARVLERIFRGDDGAQVKVLLYEDQIQELRMFMNTDCVSLRPISRTTSVLEVALQMALEASAEAPMTYFFSFAAPVIRLGPRLDAAARAKVNFLPWGDAHNALREAAAGRVAAQLGGRVEVPIPESEAVEALRDALQRRGAISRDKCVQRSVLRQMLSERDARFSKANPATCSGRFISELVRAAKAKGVVELEEREGVNAIVWLATPSGATAAVNEMAAARAPAPAAAHKRLSPTAYADILKQVHMGPFQNIRWDFYDLLEQHAAAKLPLDKLITTLLDQLRKRHVKNANLPWQTVRQFMMTLLTKCAVLLDENNQPVTPGFLTRRTKIAGVAVRFRERLDGELILALLSNGAEITYMDMPNLVGALYVTREPKWEEQLNAVISYLEDASQVVLSDSAVRVAPSKTSDSNVTPFRTTSTAA